MYNLHTEAFVSFCKQKLSADAVHIKHHKKEGNIDQE